MEKVVAELIVWSLQTISSLDLTQSSPLISRVGGSKQVCLIKTDMLHLMQKER